MVQGGPLLGGLQLLELMHLTKTMQYKYNPNTIQIQNKRTLKLWNASDELKKTNDENRHQAYFLKKSCIVRF